MQHLLSVQDLSLETVEKIFAETKAIEKDFHNAWYSRNQTMISFFVEPSTRTRFSFEAAMQHLGGRVLSAPDALVSSSLKKGETLKDTFRTLGCYGDIIVCRHSDSNWPEEAKKYARIPVINAGSGEGEHPTQALLDIYTAKKELGEIQGSNWMLCGDLLHGRTIHSLIPLLKLYKVNIFLVPAYIENRQRQIRLLNTDSKSLSFDEAIAVLPEMDIVYMTRIQHERISFTVDEYVQAIQISQRECDKMKKTARILHPGPRGREIHPEIDDDPRAAFHERQVRNGLYVRAALVKMLLERNF